MPTVLDQEIVADVLEGEWRLGATNVVEWLDGTRREVVLQFDIEQSDPLVVTEQQAYTSPDGRRRLQSIRSEWAEGAFRSRGRGILRTGATRWRLGGVSDDRATIVLRVATVREGQDALFVLVRAGMTAGELRGTIAMRSQEFGVGPEDFASLSWLDLPAPEGF